MQLLIATFAFLQQDLLLHVIQTAHPSTHSIRNRISPDLQLSGPLSIHISANTKCRQYKTIRYIIPIVVPIPVLCWIYRAALAPFLANVTAAPNSYKWILYGDDDTFWFIDNALVYLNQLDPDMPYLLSDNIWMKERTSGRTVHCSMLSDCMFMVPQVRLCTAACFLAACVWYLR